MKYIVMLSNKPGTAWECSDFRYLTVCKSRYKDKGHLHVLLLSVPCKKNVRLDQYKCPGISCT